MNWDSLLKLLKGYRAQASADVKKYPQPTKYGNDYWKGYYQGRADSLSEVVSLLRSRLSKERRRAVGEVAEG